MRKKLLAAALIGTACMTATACSQSGSTGETTAAQTTEAGSEEAASTEAETEETEKEEASEPITIAFWHDRTSDTDLAYLQKSIQEFNETNELGITVEEVAQGYLDDVQAAIETAVAAGEAPELADLSCNGIPLFASEGILADMTPYVERDGFDMDNVVKELTDYVYYEDQIVAMPYTRGTAILYYNKDLYEQAGLDHAPTSLEELNEYAKKIYEDSNGEIKGIGYTIEPTYYQHYLLASLNGCGFMDEDGLGASCVTDGTMQTFLTDWYNWTEEGWCEIPALSGASSAMQEAFYNGKLAAFVSSSNRATSISGLAAENGINLGMSYAVGYGGYSAPLGGGSIGIISEGNSEEEIAAAWEFVKFLMSDEQVAANHIETGVLPTTYSAVEGDTLQEFWADEANEGYKISYEQVEYSSAPAMSLYTSEWNSIVRDVYSELIQARDITPEQAVENLQKEAEALFPAR